MNRTLSFAAILVMATPLFAAEPKPVANPTQQTQQEADSPLVAAAKRANRLGKKPAFVITNENLVTTGGHFTTTAQQTPITQLPPLPHATPVAVDEQQKKSTPSEAEQKQRAEEERQRLVKQLRMQYEDETLNPDQDPARLEHQMEQLSKQQQEDKKPQ